MSSTNQQKILELLSLKRKAEEPLASSSKKRKAKDTSRNCPDVLSSDEELRDIPVKREKKEKKEKKSKKEKEPESESGSESDIEMSPAMAAAMALRGTSFVPRAKPQSRSKTSDEVYKEKARESESKVHEKKEKNETRVFSEATKAFIDNFKKLDKEKRKQISANGKSRRKEKKGLFQYIEGRMWEELFAIANAIKYYDASLDDILDTPGQDKATRNHKLGEATALRDRRLGDYSQLRTHVMGAKLDDERVSEVSTFGLRFMAVMDLANRGKIDEAKFSAMLNKLVQDYDRAEKSAPAKPSSSDNKKKKKSSASRYSPSRGVPDGWEMPFDTEFAKFFSKKK